MVDSLDCSATFNSNWFHSSWPSHGPVCHVQAYSTVTDSNLSSPATAQYVLYKLTQILSGCHVEIRDWHNTVCLASRSRWRCHVQIVRPDPLDIPQPRHHTFLYIPYAPVVVI